MLTSDAMMATDEDEEDSKTISLSNWVHDLLYFSLLNRLKEMQSEKLSITLRPEENSEFKELKDGKHSLTLLAKSTKCVKIVDGGLYFIFPFHFILFYFSFCSFFYF